MLLGDRASSKGYIAIERGRAMVDRIVESAEVQVPEIPEILEKALLFCLEEAREKFEKGEEIIPHTALVVKETIFIENHPGDSTKECFNKARHTVEHASGASAYVLCYDGYIEVDDGVKDALIAEGGIPAADKGYAVGYLYTLNEEGVPCFDHEPAYIGESPNFMLTLQDPASYSDDEVDEKYSDHEMQNGDKETEIASKPPEAIASDESCELNPCSEEGSELKANKSDKSDTTPSITASAEAKSDTTSNIPA